MKKLIAIISLILILIGINWSIANKENHLKNGTIAYLKLRPVDPRSLMQGDFMALRFELADKIIKALPKASNNSRRWNRNRVAATNRHVIVVLDKQRVASFKGLFTKKSKLANNEIKMQFRVRNGHVKFATNAFFFQEGTAKIYEKAKFGQFRVNKNGELLLAAMFDEKLNRLGVIEKR